MSYVADIILVTAIDDGGAEDEHPNTDRLDAWLQETHGCAFVKVDGHAGGNKAMQCDVFLAAVNFLQVEEFVTELRRIPWDHPEMVQLLIKNENDERFRSYLVE